MCTMAKCVHAAGGQWAVKREEEAKKGFARRGGLFTRVLHALHVASVYTRITRSYFTCNQ
jgi:hypothetical protein